MIQGYRLTEEDFRGERFTTWECNLRGCNDSLVLTHPEIIAEIHEKYLMAGADIISTNSFNANAISLADYELGEYAGEIARRAAEIAREVADKFTSRNPQKPRFVAGSVGPTSKTSSIATDVEHPEIREVSFEQLATAYKAQIEGLVDGGADIILLPEIPYDIDKVCKAIEKRNKNKKGFTILAVAEGAIPKERAKMSKKELKKFMETYKYPAVSYEIADELTKRLGSEVRVTVPGHTQRGGSPCPYDRVLSTRLGAACAQSIIDEHYGVMIGIVNNETKRIPLEETAGKLKYVDPDSQIIKEAKLIGISFGD